MDSAKHGLVFASLSLRRKFVRRPKSASARGREVGNLPRVGSRRAPTTPSCCRFKPRTDHPNVPLLDLHYVNRSFRMRLPSSRRPTSETSALRAFDQRQWEVRGRLSSISCMKQGGELYSPYSPFHVSGSSSGFSEVLAKRETIIHSSLRGAWFGVRDVCASTRLRDRHQQVAPRGCT